MKTSNKKYEITDIAHETYPFLHRIRALRDIGENVKAGDLGGFVEGEHNLETELSDSAWIFDDAIACGSAYVNQDSSCTIPPLPAIMPMCPAGLLCMDKPVRRMMLTCAGL